MFICLKYEHFKQKNNKNIGSKGKKNINKNSFTRLLELFEY